MKPLYMDQNVRCELGACLRPGGEGLTRKMLELLCPLSDHVLVDAGCGTGETINYLKRHGINKVFGVDVSSELASEAVKKGVNIAQARLEELPIADGTVDMVLCECVWNLTDKQKVISEFVRILRPGGRLAISDIYLRGNKQEGQNPWPEKSCFFKAGGLQEVRDMISESGFRINTLEDYSLFLRQTTAEFVFKHGSLYGFWNAVLGDPQQAKALCSASAATRPGLFLLTAQKGEV